MVLFCIRGEEPRFKMPFEIIVPLPPEIALFCIWGEELSLSMPRESEPPLPPEMVLPVT